MNKEMVIIKIMGGLGNQLFQYAAGSCVAHRCQVPLKLDLTYFKLYKNTKWARRYGLRHFMMDQVVASEEEIAETKSVRYFKESHFHYHPEIKKVGPNVYLEGYWQSKRYFCGAWSVLREEFSFRDQPSQANRRMAERIQSCASVALHIRRGDYVTDRHVRQLLGVCSMEYYERAVRYLAGHVDQPHFFVFSDDPVWVQGNLKLKYPSTLVNINNEATCYEDMRLMSLCQHHITANSTFSWWSAWLCQNPHQIVVAPKEWLSLKSSRWKTHDLIPEEWHRF